MNEKNSIIDHEISLFEILEVLWNGKWKIAYYSLTLLIPNEIAGSVGAQSMQVDTLVTPLP